jgi:hypothetical protein
MEDSLSSPARSVKVTYLGRSKRKRSTTGYNEDHLNSDSSSDGLEAKHETAGKTYSSSSKRLVSTAQPAHSKGPKKIDIHLPGPSPKRARRESEELHDTRNTVAFGKASKSLHCRSSSSISSLSNVARQLATSNSTSKKSIFLIDTTPPSLKRMTTPDTEMDDNASVAESSKGGVRFRRTEAERIQYFSDHPHCGTMEPHRVLCTKCHKFVNLGRKQTYAVRPWEVHRSRCDQKALQSNTHEREAHNKEDEASDNDEDAASTIAPSIAQSEMTVRRTEPERKAILDSDPRAETIKVDEVLCRKCQKWIRLSTKQKFALTNWNRHQRKCSDVVPSSRVATAERKLRIVNDSQAKSFGTRNVECALCGACVALEGEGDYNLTRWDEHKSHCLKPDNASMTTATTNIASKLSSGAINHTGNSGPIKFPTISDRPPPSSASASTEGTLIASDISPSTPLPRGTKRTRDEPEDKLVDDPDARPSNRPRNETYQPPWQEAPSALGWFLLPFKAFVRGFKESLRADS